MLISCLPYTNPRDEMAPSPPPSFKKKPAKEDPKDKKDETS